MKPSARALFFVINVVPAALCFSPMAVGQALIHDNPELVDLPFAMPVVPVPAFPDRQVSIAEHGGRGDGHTMNTGAFAAAIRACTDAGGGTVVVPPGTWLTGPIRLESGINLHLESGALIQFSNLIEDFPLIAGFDGKSRGYMITPPISAYRAKNIAITGNGVIDGAGEAWRYVKKSKLTENQWKDLVASGGVVSSNGSEWWPSKESMGGEKYLRDLERSGSAATVEDFRSVREYLRPDLVRLVQSDGILLDGPTFRNSPKFHLHMVQSENIVIRNVTVVTPWYAQNGDGIDLAACRNVVISHATVDVGDDALCLKPSRISDWQKPGPACENIVIVNSTVFHGHGGFVIGSESFGGVNNVLVRNCVFAGTDVGIRFKSMRGNGGPVRNVFIDGIQMRGIQEEAILFDMFYGEKVPDTKPAPVTERTPQFENISFKNIHCISAANAVVVRGLPEMPVRGIVFYNLHMSSTEGIACSNAENFTFLNSTFFPSHGPVVSLVDSKDVRLTRITFTSSTGAFLKVGGEQSRGISVDSVQPDLMNKGVEIGNEVTPGGVTVGGSVYR